MLVGTHWARRSRSLEVLEEIRSLPFRSRQEILAYQFQQLSALLSEAEAHVPYYREMFRKLGIRSRDVRNLKEFADLPILTKDIIRERQDDLISEKAPKGTLIEAYSGGSTGVPLRFYRDRTTRDATEAGLFRSLLQCKWTPGEMIAYFWGGNEHLYSMSRIEFEIRQHIRRQYQFDPFHSGPKEMERWLKKWERIRPRVAFGYTSTVARFASYIKAHGKSVPPLRGVFVTAEKLYAAQREVIASVFNCHVYDFYGSSEIRDIATECPLGSMHINSDFVVLEVDQAGLNPGESAPFIVTSLMNNAMPFIRYRNEDCGRLLDGTCECGNQFPLLELNISRIGDNFVLPGGRVVHGEFFTHLMYGTEGISMFQFHQTAPQTIVLWIVPGPGRDEAREKAIRAVIEQVHKLDPAVTVLVREIAAIPLSSVGKHRFTRSDVMGNVSL